MKHTWKKAAAGLLALVLAAGALPANTPVQDLFSAAVITAHAEAASGFCGASTNVGGEESVSWKVEQNNEDAEKPTYTITISGTGAMKDYSMIDLYGETVPWADYSPNITEVVIKSGVTSIGNDAFKGCHSLTSVNIPDGVTSIGSSAFLACSNLTSVNIPDSVTSIGESAFFKCNRLKEFVVSDDNPNYSSAQGVLFSKDQKTLLCVPGGKTGDLTIPDSVTTIAETAFTDNSLKNILVNEEHPSFSSVNGVLFSKDKKTLLSFPNSNANEYIIPDYVTCIGSYAFYRAEIWSLSIPDSVTTIESHAFEHCDCIDSIPASLTSIGEFAFTLCGSLTSVTIPNGVTSIPEGAFEGCPYLDAVTIPDSVTSIGQDAFNGCMDLSSVTIPDSVTSIGRKAFFGCTDLSSVTVARPAPPQLDRQAFSFTANDMKIYVPADKVDDYKQAENWSEYADMIVAQPNTQLSDGNYKQTAHKEDIYYTRFVFVMPRSELAGKSKAKFTATYGTTNYTYETNTYYTGVISNGVTYTASPDSAIFVVTVASGSDISSDLTCKLDLN